MTAEPFDFRQPPPTSLEGKVQQWLTQAAGLAPRVWGRLLPFPAELSVGRVASMTAAAGVEGLPNGAVAFRLKVDRAPDAAPILAFARPLLVALINGSLGVPPTELPPDRELSAVEKSVCDFLVKQLLLDLLSEGWPAAEKPKFTVALRGEPRGVSTLPANDLILHAVLTMKAPFGEHPLHLLIPRTAPVAELVKPAEEPPAPTPAGREQLEALVKEMAVEVTVPLGSTQVTMLQLAMLRPGDVVVLAQKVTEPLPARVAGKDKFAVWPGAVGRRQAIQIEALIEQ
jgi:flagellar motor switch protein FliM